MTTVYHTFWPNSEELSETTDIKEMLEATEKSEATEILSTRESKLPTKLISVVLFWLLAMWVFTPSEAQVFSENQKTSALSHKHKHKSISSRLKNIFSVFESKKMFSKEQEKVLEQIDSVVYEPYKFYPQLEWSRVVESAYDDVELERWIQRIDFWLWKSQNSSNVDKEIVSVEDDIAFANYISKVSDQKRQEIVEYLLSQKDLLQKQLQRRADVSSLHPSLVSTPESRANKKEDNRIYQKKKVLDKIFEFKNNSIWEYAYKHLRATHDAPQIQKWSVLSYDRQTKTLLVPDTKDETLLLWLAIVADSLNNWNSAKYTYQKVSNRYVIAWDKLTKQQAIVGWELLDNQSKNRLWLDTLGTYILMPSYQQQVQHWNSHQSSRTSLVHISLRQTQQNQHILWIIANDSTFTSAYHVTWFKQYLDSYKSIKTQYQDLCKQKETDMIASAESDFDVANIQWEYMIAVSVDYNFSVPHEPRTLVQKEPKTISTSMGTFSPISQSLDAWSDEQSVRNFFEFLTEWNLEQSKILVDLWKRYWRPSIQTMRDPVQWERSQYKPASNTIILYPSKKNVWEPHDLFAELSHSAENASIHKISELTPLQQNYSDHFEGKNSNDNSLEYYNKDYYAIVCDNDWNPLTQETISSDRMNSLLYEEYVEILDAKQKQILGLNEKYQNYLVVHRPSYQKLRAHRIADMKVDETYKVEYFKDRQAYQSDILLWFVWDAISNWYYHGEFFTHAKTEPLLLSEYNDSLIATWLDSLVLPIDKYVPPLTPWDGSQWWEDDIWEEYEEYETYQDIEQRVYKSFHASTIDELKLKKRLLQALRKTKENPLNPFANWNKNFISTIENWFATSKWREYINLLFGMLEKRDSTQIKLSPTQSIQNYHRVWQDSISLETNDILTICSNHPFFASELVDATMDPLKSMSYNTNESCQNIRDRVFVSLTNDELLSIEKTIAEIKKEKRMTDLWYLEFLNQVASFVFAQKHKKEFYTDVDKVSLYNWAYTEYDHDRLDSNDASSQIRKHIVYSYAKNHRYTTSSDSASFVLQMTKEDVEKQNEEIEKKREIMKKMIYEAHQEYKLGNGIYSMDSKLNILFNLETFAIFFESNSQWTLEDSELFSEQLWLYIKDNNLLETIELIGFSYFPWKSLSLPNGMINLNNVIISNSTSEDISYSALESVILGSGYSNLSYISISNCPLLHFEIKWKLPNLEGIEIKYTYLDSLPDILQYSSKIDEIDLEGNAFSSLPDWFWNFKNVKECYLSDNLFFQVPDAIRNYTNLTTLHIANNKINEIPDRIWELKDLEDIELQKNNISVLPNSLFLLKKISGIDLSYNKIAIIPSGIGKLKELSALLISNNNLISLPSSFSLLSKLINLNVSNNNFWYFPDVILSLDSLQQLGVSWCWLSDFPTKLSKLSNLSGLDISYNNISSIKVPSWLFNHIILFDASNNQIEEFPSFLLEQKKLEDLNLSFNTMKVLPSDIWSMEELEYLNLSSNKIETIPVSLFNIGKLRELNLSNNVLVYLPEFVYEDDDIVRKEINLSWNLLSRLPLGFWNWKFISDLDISDNLFFEAESLLPKEDFNKTLFNGLKMLDISNNPCSQSEYRKILHFIELNHKYHVDVVFKY